MIKQALTRFSQSILDISVSPTSIYFISSTKFITEDTPYQKFNDVILKESLEFMNDELMPNKKLHENLNTFLTDLEKILPPFSFKKISKNLTELSLNTIKEKIKNHQSEIQK